MAGKGSASAIEAVGVGELAGIGCRIPREAPGQRERVVGTGGDGDPVAAPARCAASEAGRGADAVVLQHETDERLAERRLVDLVPPFAERPGEVGAVDCVGRPRAGPTSRCG